MVSEIKEENEHLPEIWNDEKSVLMKITIQWSKSTQELSQKMSILELNKLLNLD